MADHTRDSSVDPPASAVTGWAGDRWEHATLRRATVHGIRLFNGGHYHASHDCFEDEWYNYGGGSTESSFLHGMVQVVAGVYKRVDYGNDVGMRSLFRTAGSYLRTIPSDYYGVDVDDVRQTTTEAQRRPAVVDQWRMTIDGQQPTDGPVDHAYVRSID